MTQDYGIDNSGSGFDIDDDSDDIMAMLDRASSKSDSNEYDDSVLLNSHKNNDETFFDEDHEHVINNNNNDYDDNYQNDYQNNYETNSQNDEIDFDDFSDNNDTQNYYDDNNENQIDYNDLVGDNDKNIDYDDYNNTEDAVENENIDTSEHDDNVSEYERLINGQNNDSNYNDNNDSNYNDNVEPTQTENVAEEIVEEEHIKEPPIQENNSNKNQYYDNSKDKDTVNNYAAPKKVFMRTDAEDIRETKRIVNVLDTFRALDSEKKNVVSQFIMKDNDDLDDESVLIVRTLHANPMLFKTMKALGESAGEKDRVERVFYILQLDDDVLYSLGELVSSLLEQEILHKNNRIKYSKDLEEKINTLDDKVVDYVSATQDVLSAAKINEQ